MSYVDLKGELQEYGQLVVITRKTLETNEMNVLGETAKLLSHSLQNTVDELCKDVLLSTATTISCSYGINGQSATELTKEDIMGVSQILLGNRAEFISEIVHGTEQIGTLPLRQAYWGFIDTRLLDDLQRVDGFKAASSYPGYGKELEFEWGSTDNVRWLYSNLDMTTMAQGASGKPIFNNIIVGKEAYGNTFLGSDFGELIYHPLGRTDSLLNRTASMGIYWKFNCMLLNDAWCANLQSTHS